MVVKWLVCSDILVLKFILVIVFISFGLNYFYFYIITVFPSPNISVCVSFYRNYFSFSFLFAKYHFSFSFMSDTSTVLKSQYYFKDSSQFTVIIITQNPFSCKNFKFSFKTARILSDLLIFCYVVQQ